MKNLIYVVVVLFSLACVRNGEKKLASLGEAKTVKTKVGPPMGWNSWDAFGFLLTEDSLYKAVDFMSSSLKDYGYDYIVVDMGWYYPLSFGNNDGVSVINPPQRIDQFGRLLPDTIKFPSAVGDNGLKSIGDYIHSKGLKFGLHIMRGIPWNAFSENTRILGTKYFAQDIANPTDTCEWNHSMYGVNPDHEAGIEYYRSLIALYESWGVDFIKIDDMARPYHKGELEIFSKALKESKRDIFLSLSPGKAPVEEAEHLSRYANQWRISNDVWDHWRLVKRQFEYCRDWYPHIQDNHWPDADMLPLGKLRLTGADEWVASLIQADYADVKDEYCRLLPKEQYTLMNLWSIFRSPMFFGGYPPHNDSLTTALLTNNEVIELDQLSESNEEISFQDSVSVWFAKHYKKDRRYIAVFNISEEEKRFEFPDSLKQEKIIATNIWTRVEKAMNEPISLSPHESVLYCLDNKDSRLVLK